MAVQPNHPLNVVRTHILNHEIEVFLLQLTSCLNFVAGFEQSVAGASEDPEDQAVLSSKYRVYNQL